MNTYEIQYRIHALINIYEPQTYKGFRFETWTDEREPRIHRHSWLCSKEIHAEKAEAALKNFHEELFRIVDRISFVTQSYASADLQPFLIKKQNENPDHIFFTYFSHERGGTPLSFQERELENLTLLESYQERGDVFRLISEATKATTFYTRFAMLVAAVEAIAGEINGNSRIRPRTDTNYIKQNIIKDPNLYNAIFGTGSGLRHRLLHGTKVDLNSDSYEGIEFVQDIYDCIIEYFENKTGVKFNKAVKNPQRNFIGPYNYTRMWLSPVHHEQKIDLRDVYPIIACHLSVPGAKTTAKLGEFYYVILDRPENY